jgi:small subunit ribosomal protein S2
VDFPIPANDDASRSIGLVLDVLVQAVAEGLQDRKADKDQADAQAAAKKAKAEAAKAAPEVSEEAAAEAPVAAEEVVAEEVAAVEAKTEDQADEKKA